MTMEPTPDSAENKPESEHKQTPGEQEQSNLAAATDRAADAGPPDTEPETPAAPGEKPDAAASVEKPGADVPDTVSTSPDVLPQKRPSPKPPTAAEIAASIVDDGDDAALEQDVEAAMAGVTEADLAGAVTKMPTFDEPAKDSIVQGRIANIGSQDALVDFGAKSLGSMPLAEFGKDETYAVGDSIEVMILGEDPRSGLLSVSRRKARQAKVLDAMKVGLLVDGRVVGMNKGGLEVLVEGLRGFIPASQVDLRFVKDISSLIGENIRAEVTRFELDDDTPNIVLSRRKWLLREEAERKKKLFEELEVGQTRRGKVRSTADYGAFVDIGGVDGLLHIRDMSWGRVNKAEDVVKIGDEIDVMIIKVNHEHKKVSLSLKQTVANPWEKAAEKYTAGTRLQGRVVRLAPFGAFVELEPGVDGLLPISEMSWTRHVRNPSELVKEGDVVEVAVISFDDEKRRISLSLKALAEDPWTMAAAKFEIGSKIKGKVVRTTDFGAFVELGDGIDGLVHISEISNERIRSVTDKVKPGEEVEVRILSVDAEAKRVSLSMRQPAAEPTREELAKIETDRAAAEKKRKDRPTRGGISFGWDEGLGSLDPSKFAP